MNTDTEQLRRDNIIWFADITVLLQQAGMPYNEAIEYVEQIYHVTRREWKNGD